MCKGVISFNTGEQSLTAMSTMESELVAEALAMKQTVFCSIMIEELGFGTQFEQVVTQFAQPTAI